MLRTLFRNIHRTTFKRASPTRAMSTLNSTHQISGTVDPGFESVLTAFTNNFAQHGEVGACFVGYYKGRKVVDLWGGYKSVGPARELWREDTLINTYSTTKGMAITCLLHLIDQGRCHLEDPIARHWPEFAAHDKANVRITDLLSHRAGLSMLDTGITVEMIEQARDSLDSPLARALANQKPLWQLSEGKHGYSPVVIGLYLSQLVRRIDRLQRPISRYWREEIAEPLGIEFYMGLDSSFDRSRLAQTIAFDPTKIAALVSDLSFEGGAFFRAMADPSTLTHRIWTNLAFKWDESVHCKLEMPATVGVSNAREIAKVYNSLLHSRALLKNPAVLEQATQVAAQGFDQVILVNRNYAAAGFIKPIKYPHAFYHSGSGGSCGWADPSVDLAFAYVMNSMGLHFEDPRRAALTDAMYHSIAQLASRA